MPIVALIVKILADTSELRRGVEETNTRLGAMGVAMQHVDSVVGDLRTRFLTMTASLLSAQGIITAVSFAWRTFTTFIGDSVTAFAEAEASERKLIVALQAQGQATPQVIAQYKALGQTFQQTTVYSDDLITEMMALLITVGNVMPQDMQRALQASADLAATLGIDLRVATLAVAKALEGNTTALKRYGIDIDEAALKTGGADVVFMAIAATMRNQAFNATQTLSGGILQLGNDWNNLQEVIGGVIATLNQHVGVLDLAGNAVQVLGYKIQLEIATFNEWIRRLQDGGTATSGMANTVRGAGKDIDLATESTRNLGLVTGDASAVIAHFEREEEKARQATARIAQELQNLTDKFSGAGLLAQARDYAVVLGRVGGASNLTAVEQAEMNKVFEAVVEKLRLTNPKAAELIAHYAALATQTRAVIVPTQSLQGVMNLMPGTIGSSTQALLHLLESTPIVVNDFGQIDAQMRRATVAADLSTRALANGVTPAMQAAAEAAAKARADFAAWTDAMLAVGDAISALAQATGSQFLQWLGNVVTAMGAARQAGQDLGVALANFKNNPAAGVAGVASATAGLVGAMDQATSSGSRMGNAVGGALAGMQAGAVIGTSILPGIGTAIGAVAGAAAGFFFGLGRDIAKVTTQMRDDFIRSAGGIDQLRIAADVAGVSLNTVLTTTNLKTFEAEVARIQAAMDKWKETMKALEGVSAALNTRVDLFNKSLENQHTATDNVILQFNRYGVEAVAVFVTVLQHTLSLTQAFEAIGPTLDILIELQKRLGLEGNEALNKLLAFREVVNANRDVMTSVDALAQMVRGLGQTGLLTHGLFVAFAADARQMFFELTNRGVDANTAMLLMQPTLQALWEAQNRYHFKLDEVNQALLDEAVAMGIVGASHRSVTDQMLAALLGIEGAINNLAAVLTGNAGAWTSWGNTVAGAANTAADALAGVEPPAPPAFHSGGLVTPPAYHTGGTVLQFIPRAHDGLMVDEVPIIAQTGEGILSRRGMRALDALNSGRTPDGMRGRGIVVNVTFNKSLIKDKQTIKELTQEIARELPRAVRAAGGVR